ncbi:MAG: type IV pilin protein, partial [bacterium]
MVVIIGVLAAIAIPKFNDSKRKAQVSAMKGALRTAMAGAEAHFADNNTYVGFTIPSSAPVSVTALNNTAQFVYMTAAHSSLTGVVCWVWLGDGDTGVL